MDPTYKGLPTPLPTVQKRGGPNLRLAMLIGGGFLVLIVVLGLIFGGGGTSTNDRQRLLYRLDALIAMTNTAKLSLKSDNLQKINAELSLVLTSDQTAVTAVIPAAKATKELSALKTEEADAELVTTLKAAAANGTYDSAYKAALQEKLSATYSLANELVANTSSSAIKTALTPLNEHITSYFNQLKETN